jgi:hypothetical protein
MKSSKFGERAKAKNKSGSGERPQHICQLRAAISSMAPALKLRSNFVAPSKQSGMLNSRAVLCHNATTLLTRMPRPIASGSRADLGRAIERDDAVESGSARTPCMPVNTRQGIRPDTLTLPNERLWYMYTQLRDLRTTITSVSLAGSNVSKPDHHQGTWLPRYSREGGLRAFADDF